MAISRLAHVQDSDLLQELIGDSLLPATVRAMLRDSNPVVAVVAFEGGLLLSMGVRSKWLIPSLQVVDRLVSATGADQHYVWVRDRSDGKE